MTHLISVVVDVVVSPAGVTLTALLVVVSWLLHQIVEAES
jgi:hypothetical protein